MTPNTSQEKNRYCAACGTKMEKNNDRCPSCKALGGNVDIQGLPEVGAGGVGYAKDLSDPGFHKLKGKTRIITLVFIFALSVILAVVLLILKVSPIMAAAVAGALFVVIAVPYLLSTRRKKSWEGTVEEKNILSAMSRYDNLNTRHKYRIIFKTTDGKRKVWTDDHLYARVFGYLNEGDRVRYIGQIGTKCAFEKYDKSADIEIMCVSCCALNDARQKYCVTCGCLLPKGQPVFR